MGAPMCWFAGVWLHVGRELLELVTVSPRPAAGAPAPKFRNGFPSASTAAASAPRQERIPHQERNARRRNQGSIFFSLSYHCQRAPPVQSRSAGHCHSRPITMITGPSEDRIYPMQDRYANEGNETPKVM